MESLIHRIANALAYGLSGREIAERFASEGSPEQVWLAYMAAKIVLKDAEVAAVKEAS